MASIHEEDANGKPTSWDWGGNELRHYVIEQCRAFAERVQQECHATNKEWRATEKDVQDVGDIIISCLDNKSAYAHNTGSGVAGAPEVIKFLYVSLYGCPIYPITDIFTALGWFITATDGRVLKEDENILDENLKTIILFSRLLFNVSKTLGTPNLCPAMTHVFLSIGFEETPRITFGVESIDRSTKTYVSSSLPMFKKKLRAFKKAASEERIEALKFVSPSLNPQDFIKHLNKVGFCAETLNAVIAAYLQKRKAPRKHTLVYGSAVQVKAMDRKFEGFDKCLEDDAAVPPCESCLHLFEEFEINFFDISTLVRTGKLPPGYVKDKRWGVLVKCEYCHEMSPLSFCSRCSKCNTTWCNVVVGYPESACWKAGRIHEHFCPQSGSPADGNQSKDVETLASLPTGAGSASATIPIVPDEPSEGLQAPGAEAQDESESLNVGLNDRLDTMQDLVRDMKL